MSFALPRAEVGQGITTAMAMIDRRGAGPAARQGARSRSPTPGPSCCSTSSPAARTRCIAIYTPIRVAAAVARGALLEAAADRARRPAVALLTLDGRRDHRARRQHRSLRRRWPRRPRVATTEQVDGRAQGAARRSRVVGKPHNRIDARDIVTGRKKFAMDLDGPGRAADDGLPAADDQRHGRRRSRNLAAVQAMPGRHRRRRRSPPASRCAPRRSASASTPSARSKVDWGPGTVDGKSDADVLAELRGAELPLPCRRVPRLAKTVEAEFTFHFRQRPRWRPTARSPTCEPTGPRSGPA